MNPRTGFESTLGAGKRPGVGERRSDQSDEVSKLAAIRTIARDGILGPFGGLRSNDAQSGSKSDPGWPNSPALASVLDSKLPQMGECPALARLGHLHLVIGAPAVGRFSWQSAARAQARLLNGQERQRSSSASPAVSAGGAIPSFATQPLNRPEARRRAVALT